MQPLSPVAGVRLAAVEAGIRKAARKDLVLFELAPGSRVSGVFTRNAFCAAPVVVAREHLAAAAPRYWLVNTGNANAGTGATGLQAAQQSCAVLAAVAGCSSTEVLPFSTGVIGEPLPVERITSALPALVDKLGEANWHDAAHGILTTDTVAKGATRQIEIGGQTVTLTGIAKGSGMIRPDMATMLAFIATDAAVSQSLLDAALRDAVDHSFNRITVDGDTSTNDACMVVATGQSRAPLMERMDDPGYQGLCEALTAICTELAQAIVRDGEGATKFITITVNGGRTQDESLAVAWAVAGSPLVKTAFFASDPNWGRILAAVGRAGIVGLDLERVTIDLGEVRIVSGGGRAADYTEARGQTVMARSEIPITIDLGRGDHSERVWTCDFSYDYVKINAEYRT